MSSGVVKEFNQHFNDTLLPAQLKHGARLIGRWKTSSDEEEVEIFAIWEYDSYEDYEIIEGKVRSDGEQIKRVQEWFAKMGGREKLKESFFKIDQDFLESTLTNEFSIK
ncbi:NIPSNAP family protein [Lysinibacillus sphaericus]